MHVGKSPLQPALRQQIHRQRGPRSTKPDTGDVMVHCQNLENASYALIDIYVFVSFYWDLAHGPYNTKPVNGMNHGNISSSIEILCRNMWYGSHPHQTRTLISQTLSLEGVICVR